MSRTVVGFCACLWLLSLLLFPQRQPARPQVAPQGMPPHPRLEEKIKRGEVSLPRFLTDPAARRLGLDRPRTGPHALTGTIKILAVLVDFSDNVHTVSADFFDSLIFAAPVAGRGSVRDYFQEVSYAQVDIVAVNLPSSLGWQRAPETYSYYVGGQNCTDAPYPNNCQKLAEDVVDAVNSLVDFSPYDNDHDGYAEPILLIHAGPGGEFTGNKNDMWSHARSLKNPRSYDGVTIAAYILMPEYQQTKSASSSDITIGVFAHEMGHGFWGLPDLYDRTPDSSSDSQGIGNWSLMAGGSWNGPDRDGSSPAWPDAWSRLQMGFITVTNVTSNISAQIPQTYDNPAAQTVLKLRSPALGSQEYFLLENRQQVPGSYDEYLPGSGLLIWHVDEAMYTHELQNDYQCILEPHCLCLDNQHYLVALEQADGQRDLERKNNAGDAADPFPGSTNNRAWTRTTHPESSSWYACTNTCIGVSNISNSADTMTADLQVSCGESQWQVYLPLVLKKYSPAPAFTPTPTTTAAMSPTPTRTKTATPTLTATAAVSPTPTRTKTATPTPTPTQGPSGWVTIVSEDFEGSFPDQWDVFDNNGTSDGVYYWAKRDCRPYAGSYSGWAVGGGDGANLDCDSDYPDNADAWMVYGPFSLVGATDGELRFQLWLNSAQGDDQFCWLASLDGNNFDGHCTSGPSAGWSELVLDLTNVPNLGNLLEQSSVWVALMFTSDSLLNYQEGAYVDDIVLRKCTSATCSEGNGAAPADDSPVVVAPFGDK